MRPDESQSASERDDVIHTVPAASWLQRPADPVRLQPEYTAGIQRLALLQTLAARQKAILEAQTRGLAALSSPTSVAPPVPASYPYSLPTQPAVSSPTLTFPQSPNPLQSAPTPPPTPALDWGSHSLNDWLTEDARDRHPPAASTSHSRRTTTPTAPAWPVSDRDLQIAQEQLDAWTALNIPQSSATPFTAAPTYDLGNALVGGDPTFPFNSIGTPPISYPLPEISPTTSSSDPWRAPEPASVPEESVPPPPRSSRSRSGSKARIVAEPIAESEVGSGDDDDKRRRNTEASARFRAKKKQRDQQLQQTSIQLRERVVDLEKEASSLKAENQWLRELISEKADPR